MRRAAAALVMLAMTSAASAITVDFTSSLAGPNERPDPVPVTGTGSASGQLTGDPGTFVFTYNIVYSGLTGPAILGHIHDAITPAGQPFTEQFGPPVHDLDSLESPINGEWRHDDAAQPLTDELASALQAGRLYINLHTDLYPGGEIRGQLVPVPVQPPPDPDPNPIPLPAPLWAGLIGLAGSTFTAWRARRHA